MSDLVTLEASYAIAKSPHPIRPLSVLLSPSGHYAIEAGETVEISLTLNNQGDRGAVIDVYIDETSEEFCQWCSNPYERLALEVGHSSEVRFKVAIPVQTLPGTYDYLIIVDAPDHYPEDTPLRYPATVRVLPPVKSAINLNDATFATRPETSSAQPVILQPRIPVEVQVIVHNRSDRVDQFRLEITDLPEAWYQIIYPEGLGELGLIIDTDYLALNPGVKGLIRFVITCPATALAGRYLATLRLRSANEPDLVLMDMLYFEVPAVYDLQVKPEAIVRQVKRQAALFHLHITNAGNTARAITLQAQEDREDPLFGYQIEPWQLRIPSMTTAQATLTATPAAMRKRAWIGRGRQVTFRLVADDHHHLPLPEAAIAEVLWERRPWWHLAIVILLALGVLGTIASLFWWLFLRPPAPPKVTLFGTTAPTYYQQQNDFVRLNWQIENAHQIQTLALRSQANQGATATQPVTYDFSDGLPAELDPYCVLEKTLSCSSVLTSARQPGSYQFTLTVLPQNDKATSVVAETTDIQVLPTPPPTIHTFAATQPRYWEALDPSLLKSEQPSDSEQAAQQPAPTAIALNWHITFTEPISHLTLLGRLADGTPLAAPQRYDLTEGLPEALAEVCTLTATHLTCRAVPTDARTVGTYGFELSVFSADNSAPITTAETEPTRIVSAPIQIETFTLNGEAVSAKHQIRLAPAAAAADTEGGNTVQLAWRVVGGPHTRVEILPTPGTVPLEGNLAYPLTANTQEVVTLQVTSVNGEQLTRSVTLETSQPLQPSLPPPASPGPAVPLAPPAPIETTLPIPPPVSERGSMTEDVPGPAETLPVESAPVESPPVESLPAEEPNASDLRPSPPAKPSVSRPVKPKPPTNPKGVLESPVHPKPL